MSRKQAPAAGGAKLTPVFEQYLRIKSEHPDALLFFRMGDFYELFFEDAEVAARELALALTCRNPNADVRVPMCGVPHHAVDGYLSQLLDKGFKVAICDQVEDPRQAKGLVKRAVTRVLTPGTVLEDANLYAKAPNFLAALHFNPLSGAGGLAWVDFSTGECSGLFTRSEPELWQWAVKINPRELLLAQGRQPPKAFQDLSAQVTHIPAQGFLDLAQATERVLAAQAVTSLKTLDLDERPELTQALGAALSYLRQTQKQELLHLGEFKPLELSRHLILDEVTERNLEIFQRLDGRSGKGTLWHELDRTLTPMGGRLLRDRLKQPWRDISAIERTQDAVEFLFARDDLRDQLRKKLDTVYDLERLSTRVVLGRAQPRDLVALRQSLQGLPGLRHILAGRAADAPQDVRDILANWDDIQDLAALLAQALVDSPPPVITEGGLFKPGHDPKLDELIRLTEHGEATLAALLAEERETSGIQKLKLGFNKVFGYYFELSKAFQGQVPEHFIRRQTLVSGERYVTPRLKELEERMLSAAEERKSLEYKLFQELREILARARARFMYMAHVLAGLDLWQALAETARVLDWTRPEVHEGLEIEIEQGRHPVVEAGVGAGNFVPNDLVLDERRRILLITGPNMAGKSTVLRQVAIFAILAQAGSFVPARRARLGLADRVFSRVGASDNLAQGQSTFMVEMLETARILRQAGPRSLVILDEIGRGTSTFDGLALAWAVVEELSRRGRGGIRTLFATHYFELTGLEGRVPGLRNLNIAVREWKGDIVFLRKLVPGPADKSYGVEVAKLAGVPRPVVERAREILAQLEEKSQNGGAGQTAAKAVQTALPGLAPAVAADPHAAPPDPAEARVLAALRGLDAEGLAPIQALNLLFEWRKALKDV